MSLVCLLQLKFGSNEPFWVTDPKFVHVRRAQFAAHGELSAMGQNAPMAQQLKQAQSLDDAQDAVRNGSLAKISGVLMVLAEDVHVDAPMATYGLDSLVRLRSATGSYGSWIWVCPRLICFRKTRSGWWPN